MLLVAYKLSITLVYYRLVSSSLRQFSAGFFGGGENRIKDAQTWRVFL